MSLSQKLLEVLVCPETKEDLVYFERNDFLFSPDKKVKYNIQDGIPVMLIDEAEKVSEGQANELMNEAREKDLENANMLTG